MGLWHRKQGAICCYVRKRLVHEAGPNPCVRRPIKDWRSTPEQILTAHLLGYRITRIDLQRAWEQEGPEYRREGQG